MKRKEHQHVIVGVALSSNLVQDSADETGQGANDHCEAGASPSTAYSESVRRSVQRIYCPAGLDCRIEIHMRNDRVRVPGLASRATSR